MKKSIFLMKGSIFLLMAAVLIVGFAFLMIANINSSSAQVSKFDGKFEGYRATIKYAYQIDIANFKDKIPGGMADGKAITDYDLGQLLEGIKWEREHANDSFIALEIAMDHLERIPDYYTHLARMERQCDSEKFLNM